MRLLIALALGAAMTPALAQDPPPGFAEGAEAIEAGKAALDCAMYAANAGDDLSEEALRLVTLAHSKITERIQPMMKTLFEASPGSGGPMAGYLERASSDFWMGTYFASASAEATSYLEQKVPFNLEIGWDATQLQRRFEAEAEYRRRNCRFIGR